LLADFYSGWYNIWVEIYYSPLANNIPGYIVPKSKELEGEDCYGKN